MLVEELISYAYPKANKHSMKIIHRLVLKKNAIANQRAKQIFDEDKSRARTGAKNTIAYRTAKQNLQWR